MKHSILSAALLCALSAPAFAGDMEDNYQRALESAWGSVGGGSTQEICRDAVKLSMLSADEKEDFYASKCVTAIEAKKAKLIADVEAGKAVPGSCHEWAIAKGDDWLSAKSDMGYNPLLTMEQGAVFFRGKLKTFKDGGKDVLYATSSDDVKMALDFDYDPFMVDKEKLVLGSSVRGYADKYYAVDVKLLNGESTTISMGKVFCIEPNVWH